MIDTPGAVAKEVREALKRSKRDIHEQECLVVLALGSRQGLIDCTVLTAGNMSHTIVDPSQVLRWALTRKRPVRALVISHNHPSGDPSPSKEDIVVTNKVGDACRAVGLQFLDHVVVTDLSYCSLAAEGHIREHTSTYTLME